MYYYTMTEAERSILTQAEHRMAWNYSKLSPQERAAFDAGAPDRQRRAAAFAADLAAAEPQGAAAAVAAGWDRGSALGRGEPVPPTLPIPRAIAGKITLNPDDVWDAAFARARSTMHERR